MDIIKTSQSHPIYAPAFSGYWGQAKGYLGITLAPGKKQKAPISGGVWQRDMRTDIVRLKDELKYNTVVSLVQAWQQKKLGTQNQRNVCQQLGIQFIEFPVKDNSIPLDVKSYKMLIVETVEERLKKGKNVLVHCVGGLGRAGTFVAACLIYGGMQNVLSISQVRKKRPNAIQSEVQQKFIENLKFP